MLNSPHFGSSRGIYLYVSEAGWGHSEFREEVNEIPPLKQKDIPSDFYWRDILCIYSTLCKCSFVHPPCNLISGLCCPIENYQPSSIRLFILQALRGCGCLHIVFTCERVHLNVWVREWASECAGGNSFLASVPCFDVRKKIKIYIKKINKKFATSDRWQF